MGQLGKTTESRRTSNERAIRGIGRRLDLDVAHHEDVAGAIRTRSASLIRIPQSHDRSLPASPPISIGSVFSGAVAGQVSP
jgi:hypothetical protein